MPHLQLIESNYQEAVKGIDEKTLSTPHRWYQYVQSLPQSHKITYTVAILHQQVFNGGFHQYFFNGYGLFAYQTLDSLQQIEAYPAKQLLQKVLQKVNENDWDLSTFQKLLFYRKMDKINQFDPALWDYLEICDEAFYQMEDALLHQLETFLQKSSAKPK